MAASRATLEGGIEGMDRARAGLSGGLWILLLGGTGVGKSTLLDALAGKDIAPVSARRPTTVRTTFYAHREASLGPLGEVPAGAGELAAHSIEALRDKVVIDPPDFDSAVDANRRRLMPLLDAADLVVVVADGEKYRDEALYELLARYRGEKAFLFVMNKLDLGLTDDVRDDFRAALEGAGFDSPRMLAVSAREAFEARVSGREPGDAAGDFAELERIVAEELDRARIREIKEANLAGVAAHVLAAFEGAVGADARERLEGWCARCRGIASGVSMSLTERFSRAVLGARGKPHADELRTYLHGLQLFSFGGVFGVYLALSEKLRSLLGRAWSRPVDRIEARALAEARRPRVRGRAFAARPGEDGARGRGSGARGGEGRGRGARGPDGGGPRGEPVQPPQPHL
jgi:energy-coupling factor transporter ATP-binding protein EcfA2